MKCCYWRVPNTFIEMLCAQTVDKEGRRGGKRAWLEKQFHLLEGLFLPAEFLSKCDVQSAD